MGRIKGVLEVIPNLSRGCQRAHPNSKTSSWGAYRPLMHLPFSAASGVWPQTIY